MQARGKPTLGSDDYTAPNPDFGATFTYHLAETQGTARDARRDAERAVRLGGGDVPFPGYDALRQEALESGPRVLVLVRDAAGDPVNWVEGSAEAGLHRVTWDLRHPAPDPVDLSTPGFVPPWAGPPQGPLAAPGTYRAELLLVTSDGVRTIGDAQSFDVLPVPGAPVGTDFEAVVAFQLETAGLLRRVSSAGEELGRARDRLRHMRAALLRTPSADASLFGRMDALGVSLAALQVRLFGDGARQRLNESAAPSIMNRVRRVAGGHWNTRQTPTATHRRNVDIAATDFAGLVRDLGALLEGDLAQLESDLEAAGAPWTPGRRLPP
jgi:hypothetical protein